jgi:predicted kinase
MRVYIMRGLPGCGKSTWIKSRLPVTVKVVSADHFHTGADGVYRYDPKKAGEAHGDCLREFTRALNNKDTIQNLVVDNTNTSIGEIAPYVALALAFGVEHEIIYLPCSVEKSIARNVHAVPHGTILEMNRRLFAESLPPHWNVRVEVSP